MLKHIVTLILMLLCMQLYAQEYGVPDPQVPTDLPIYWKSTLADIDAEIALLQKGESSIIARTPGDRPVYLVSYGEKQDFHSTANFNSAVGARNPVYYAHKDSSARPVLYLVGPVHGHEIENIMGLVNLMHVLETGVDYRGKAWPELVSKAEQCRILIIPCANPDGRARCPYNSFYGLPTLTMTKYGQGTRKDGSLWGWPQSKAVHPMRGDVGILGCYFNDDGINIMHDEFFAPWAEETKAILNVARREAPDIAVSLHSNEVEANILQPAYEPMYLKQHIMQLCVKLCDRYTTNGLPYGFIQTPEAEDAQFPPKTPFNLASALHHISGAMAFTYEARHGCISEGTPDTPMTMENILDMQLNLYDILLEDALENPMVWEK